MFGTRGPFADPRRASSGYLVSVDKVPRILVDAGGGVYERIGMSEFNLATLEQLLLTHMHIDHSSEHRRPFRRAPVVRSRDSRQ